MNILISNDDGILARGLAVLGLSDDAIGNVYLAGQSNLTGAGETGGPDLATHLVEQCAQQLVRTAHPPGPQVAPGPRTKVGPLDGGPQRTRLDARATRLVVVEQGTLK